VVADLRALLTAWMGYRRARETGVNLDAASYSVPREERPD
jgi:hypothetical protein